MSSGFVVFAPKGFIVQFLVIYWAVRLALSTHRAQARREAEIYDAVEADVE